MIISIIAAYAKDAKGNLVIGKDNAIPWYAPHDLARFKEHTTGHPVIMGRKTHESIGRLLPNRTNIIVTRQLNYFVSGGYVFGDLKQALDFADKLDSEVFILGGQEIYNQTIDLADRLYLTYIYSPGIEGDAFFPKWNHNLFKMVYKENGPDGRMDFEIFQRIKRNDKEISVQPAQEIEEQEHFIPYPFVFSG